MHVAVDVGGTFTDIVVAYEDGRVIGYKTPSTKPNIIDGLFNGLQLIASDSGIELDECIRRLTHIDFGTTVATNALLEGKAARTGLIVTKGFRDTLLIREGGKDDTYDMKAVYPAPYISRALTMEVAERITAEGDVLAPLDEASVLGAVAALREQDVEAIAISLLWSIANPSHERRVAEIVRREMPEVAISLGHEVNPCVREYRRTISVAIDASLKPIVAHNVNVLERRLKDHDFRGKVSYITSTGGKASATDILKRPVYLCFSGPSAAPEAGKYFARLEGFEHGNVITVDMGGTSFDVSVVSDWNLPMHREGAIAGLIFGVPSVEIHTIGAGGGSIARVDSGGFLHVGPQSAGSQPGPACYRRGGTAATVTDANLIAGNLSGAFFAGGGMTLSRELADRAIGMAVARPLALEPAEAAGLVVHACEQNMVAAIEDITVKRGIDPREFVMVAGGAAAGAHAVAMAQDIGIQTIVIPRMAGVLSAFGILAGETSFNFARSFFTSSDAFDHATVLQKVAELEREGHAFLDAMGVPAANQILEFSCEARYAAQVWQLTLPFDLAELRDSDALRRLRASFHLLHARTYSASSEGEAVEFTEWNVKARGRTLNVDIGAIDTAARSTEPISSRSVYFKRARKTVDVPVYGPLGMPIGTDIRGPLLIDENLTTIVIPPDAHVQLTRFGDYIVRLAHIA